MLDKIAEMFGADPTHYRQLRKVEKTVATRAVDVERERGFANASLGITCFICFIFSAVIAMVVFFLPLDIFSYTLLTLSGTMVLVVLLILPHFDIILSPTNYLVVSHTPVSSRTYFIVKLTQLLTYAVLLLGCLNLLPAIFGLWTEEQNPFFPVVYLPISFIAGFFMIGLMTAFAGYLTKLYTKERFRNIAQCAQLAFTVFFPAIYLLGPRFFTELATDKMVSLFKAFYLLPNSWFAGAVSLALGNTHRQFLILTALAIAAIVLLVVGPLHSIAKSYSKYLASLSEARRTRSSQLKIKTSVVARLFRRREICAASDLVFAYLRRDRTTQFRFLRELGTAVIVLILVFRDHDLFLNSIGKTFTIWLALGVSAFFFFIGLGFIGTFLGQIRYSDHWKAAWLFRCASLAAPHALWRGVQATALVYMIFPYTLLFATVATFLWPRFWGGFYVLPGLIGLLCYVVFHPKPSSGLPLSQEYSQSKRYTELIPFLCGLLIFGAVLTLQFVMYKIHLGLYIACYSVTIIAGILLFIYFFGKKEEQISKNQIGVEAYTPTSI
jgi:hypothetical protein